MSPFHGMVDGELPTMVEYHDLDPDGDVLLILRQTKENGNSTVGQ
jgi:hypothetical protein